MDGAAPFQPWTSSDGDVNIKDEKSPAARSSGGENAASSGDPGDSRGTQEDLEPRPGPSNQSAPPPNITKMDADKVERMQQIVENTLSNESKQHIMQLLEQVEGLTGAERLLLYLKLPAGPPTPDPLKQPLNPLGSRSEIHQTVMWIQTHLEVDPEISLPKQDVYDEYLDYCSRTQMKALSTADFGKVMKQVYPSVKPRRLGTRGNSRYCYAGMRKRVKLAVPQLPDLSEKKKMMEIPAVQINMLIAASELIREWAEKILGIKFVNLTELAQHLIDKNYVDTNSMAAHGLINCATDTDVYDMGDTKHLLSQPKPQPRGVIKQLKRKIQSQPQVSPGKSTKAGKKNKSLEQSDEAAEDPTNQPSTSASLPRNPPIKTEMEIPAVPDYAAPSRLAAADPPKRNIVYSPHKPITEPLEPPLVYNQDIPKEYPRSQMFPQLSPYSNRLRYHLQESIPPSKHNIPLSRHAEYDPYKYNTMYGQDSQQPHNLSTNSYQSQLGYQSNLYAGDISSQFTASSNLPINLSNNSSDESLTSQKFYKSPDKVYHSPPIAVHSTPYDAESYGMKLPPRRTEWQPQHNPPVKLPLPGKKMILEAYNNENNISSPQSYYSEQVNVIKPTISPRSTDSEQVEYLPKKMRATESFSGKLAASRALSLAASAEAQSKETDKPVTEVSHATQQAVSSHVFVENLSEEVSVKASKGPGFDANVSANIPSAYPHSQEYGNPGRAGASGFLPEEMPLKSLETKETAKKVQKNARGSKKTCDKQTDSTNSNLGSVAPPKQATRGRPRKKSLTKAKYTRRQPRGGAAGAQARCDHTKVPKRSSDSCCGLSVDIKAGIICEENHSEILNRQRVHSVCNMDKHALDDYLIEGNSQENEEELMQYFQHNSDSQSNDDNVKNLAQGVESTEIRSSNLNQLKLHSMLGSVDERGEGTMSSASAANTNLSSLHETSTQGSDFLESNLDVHEDHSQSKNEKLSQVRELLEKNLISSGALKKKPAEPESTVVSKHPGITGLVTNLAQTTEGTESAFTSIGKRNVSISNDSLLEYKEGSAAASLSMLSQRQQNITERPENISQNNALLMNRTLPLNARRRVSFETPNPENDLRTPLLNREALIYNRLGASFVPISDGRISPVGSNKNSPMLQSKLLLRGACTSPVSSSASPFVSPHNTPVPRARNTGQLKPIPKLQAKRLSRAGKLNRESLYHTSLLKNTEDESGNFAIPHDQNVVPKAPGCITKVRNLPMSAPPSPNILASKYKPNFQNHTNSSAGILQSYLQDVPNSQSNYQMGYDALGLQTTDLAQANLVHPHSADPLSREVSQFFPDNTHIALNDGNSSLRSQSVPLHQEISLDPSNPYLDQNHPVEHQFHRFYSYNNTPCSSIAPTPVPREFSDFGNLNDTCESISKAGLDSANLDKIYNVLDSNIQADINMTKQNGQQLLMNHENLTLGNFCRELSTENGNLMEQIIPGDMNLQTLYPQNGDSMTKQITYPEQLSLFQGQAQANNDYLKRSNSDEFNNVSEENRYHLSRSVPSTPVPSANMPYRINPLHNFNISKAQNFASQQFQDSYGTKNLYSKSVPSTPLLTEERNMFTYNRDFLINGNSVDHISNSLNDKKLTTGNGLDDNFMHETDGLLEPKANDSVLGGLADPLPETMDMGNTSLVNFNDDCMELPSFTEQGSENDLLGVLDKIEPF